MPQRLKYAIVSYIINANPFAHTQAVTFFWHLRCVDVYSGHTHIVRPAAVPQLLLIARLHLPPLGLSHLFKSPGQMKKGTYDGP